MGEPELKREVRLLQRELAEFLRSDLYERVKMRDDANHDTDGEWESPGGWRVRLTRPDLAGGPVRIDVMIFAPDGTVYASLSDVGSAYALDEALP